MIFDKQTADHYKNWAYHNQIESASVNPNDFLEWMEDNHLNLPSALSWSRLQQIYKGTPTGKMKWEFMHGWFHK